MSETPTNKIPNRIRAALHLKGPSEPEERAFVLDPLSRTRPDDTGGF